VLDRREGETGKFATIRRWRGEADADENGGADDEHEYRVVQEVHVDQPANRRLIEAMRFVDDFEDESNRSENEPAEKRGERADAVHARPENPEDETDGNRRTDVRLHRLQIDEQLRADQADEGHPQDTEQHEESGRRATEIDKLPFGGPRRDFLVEV